MADPTYPLFSFFAFLGFLLTLIPLSWHLEAWNSGTCYYMLWASVACLNQFVNSVVWAGNALNPAPVWCDISTRIMLGSAVGIPAASLCINKRLYQISGSSSVTITYAEKRRAILIDTLICVIFPLIYIAVSYIVQGHRYDIYEDIGCFPAIYNTLLSYFLVTMWPIIIGLVSAIYCALTLRNFIRRRAQFSQFLSNSSKSLTIGRYFRLMALASTELLFTTPLALFMLCMNASGGPLEPWRSWSDTHYHFARVDQVPALIWRQSSQAVLGFELSRWNPVVCALVFFGFFGFAEEARKHYWSAFWAVAKTLRMSQVSTPSTPSTAVGRFYPNPPTIKSFISSPQGLTSPVIDIKRLDSPTSSFPYSSDTTCFNESTNAPTTSGLTPFSCPAYTPSLQLSDAFSEGENENEGDLGFPPGLFIGMAPSRRYSA